MTQQVEMEKRVQSNKSFWRIHIRWEDEVKDWICLASGKFGWDIFSSVRFHYQPGMFTLIRITIPKLITSLYSYKTDCIFVRDMHAEKSKKSARWWAYCDKNLEILNFPSPRHPSAPESVREWGTPNSFVKF